MKLSIRTLSFFGTQRLYNCLIINSVFCWFFRFHLSKISSKISYTNVIPHESTFAAIRVSVPTLYLLKNVIPTSTYYLVAHAAKRLNNPPPKSHHLKSLIKNHKHTKHRNTHTQSLLLPNLQIDLGLLDTPLTLPNNQYSRIPPSKSNANTPNENTTTPPPIKYTDIITLF